MNCHFLFLYGFLIGYIFRVSCTVHTVQSVSLLSLKRLCGLRNACTALVASSRQNTTYLATRVKTSSHIFGDEVKTRAKREATFGDEAKSDGDSREDRGI